MSLGDTNKKLREVIYESACVEARGQDQMSSVALHLIFETWSPLLTLPHWVASRAQEIYIPLPNASYLASSLEVR